MRSLCYSCSKKLWDWSVFSPIAAKNGSERNLPHFLYIWTCEVSEWEDLGIYHLYVQQYGEEWYSNGVEAARRRVSAIFGLPNWAINFCWAVRRRHHASGWFGRFFSSLHRFASGIRWLGPIVKLDRWNEPGQVFWWFFEAYEQKLGNCPFWAADRKKNVGVSRFFWTAVKKIGGIL